MNMDEELKPRNRILVAEDDAVSRRMLQSLLGKWGYEVESASDGIEALHLLERTGAPPMAILDWMMPGLEGPQICQRLREDSERPYVYVLLLTARSQKGDLLRGLESGADDYITKPFDAQELRVRLNVGQRILDLQKNLIHAREELRFTATHDSLTGMANRALVLQAFEQEYARQSREGGSFGVIMADIDHFKSVNDSYGHLGGDEVLREVTRRMKASVRPYDTVGRYGGEEFLIVVPSSEGLGTLRLADRIRKAIEASPVVTDAAEIRVTASFGVAASTSARPLSPDMLLQLADKALYTAKQQGRNRAEIGVPERTNLETEPEATPLKSGSR
jgi:two-component system cell cycle response regulator